MIVYFDNLQLNNYGLGASKKLLCLIEKSGTIINPARSRRCNEEQTSRMPLDAMSGKVKQAMNRSQKNCLSLLTSLESCKDAGNHASDMVKQ